MFGVWLTGVLVVVVASASREEAPVVPGTLIDAYRDDVTTMLGQPNGQMAMLNGDLVVIWIYRGVDCLGGRRQRVVTFGFRDDMVKRDGTGYQPFIDTPPWLASIRALATAGR